MATRPASEIGDKCGHIDHHVAVVKPAGQFRVENSRGLAGVFIEIVHRGHKIDLALDRMDREGMSDMNGAINIGCGIRRSKATKKSSLKAEGNLSCFPHGLHRRTKPTDKPIGLMHDVLWALARRQNGPRLLTQKTDLRFT